MSDTPEREWQTPVYGILTHPERPVVLFWESDAGATLPFFTLFDDGLWLGVDVVQEWLAKKIGVPVNVLRRAAYRSDEDAARGEAVYILEARSTPGAVTGRWETRSTLPQLALSNEHHRDLLETHFAELDGRPAPPRRAPWAQPRWHAAATAWIEEQLDAAGEQVKAIAPLRSWGLSCVFKVLSRAGAAYIFKAGREFPLFVNEGLLLQTLARRYGDVVPAPIAIAADQQWLLIPEAAGTIEYDASVENAATMLRALGGIQKDAANRVDELFAAGCIDRRPAWLADQVAALLLDDTVVEGLDPAEVSGLRGLIPALEQRCQALADDPLPATLVHGDFHPGNVAVDGERPCIFDWTDACISHPFFDLLMVYGAQDPEKQRLLRNAYLDAWTGRSPRAALVKAYRQAEPLCAFNQAVSYWGIQQQLEPSARHELAWGVPHWLRLVLNTMEPG